jgi:D-beta-D-heptose 7-phosphate kinase/D-beta-D-heptose 1-phosphate adenosyltransferase
VYRELLEWLQKAPAPRIGVVGDVMLDKYLWGSAERISPEAPVPVVEIDRDKTYTAVGGAGSVMRDLKALGARVWAASVVGDDEAGGQICSKLKADEIDTSAVVSERGRITTLKTRLLSRTQHIMRIDEQETRPLKESTVDDVCQHVRRQLSDTRLLILSDYIPTMGLLSRKLIERILKAAREKDVPVWADPARQRDFLDFKGVTAVTPNRKETTEATGIAIEPGTRPDEAAAWLLEELDLEIAVITLDVEGIYYRTSSGESAVVPAHPRSAYDVTGAGDMVIAAATFALSGGMDLKRAVAFANYAAGIEVEKIGVRPIERREIIRRLMSDTHIASEKVVTVNELLPLLDNHRRCGESVVFTNGCFDVIHPGHVKFLEFAGAQGDVLVVGLNSDASVGALKGPGRPIMNEGERSAVLAAMGAVDYVVIFEEETPAALIKRAAPDILVKGEDWRRKGVVGRETVEAAGGKVLLAPLVEGISTSSIIDRIRAAHPGGNEGEQDRAVAEGKRKDS